MKPDFLLTAQSLKTFFLKYVLKFFLKYVLNIQGQMLLGYWHYKLSVQRHEDNLRRHIQMERTRTYIEHRCSMAALSHNYIKDMIMIQGRMFPLQGAI